MHGPQIHWNASCHLAITSSFFQIAIVAKSFLSLLFFFFKKSLPVIIYCSCHKLDQVSLTQKSGFNYTNNE